MGLFMVMEDGMEVAVQLRTAVGCGTFVDALKHVLYRSHT